MRTRSLSTFTPLHDQEEEEEEAVDIANGICVRHVTFGATVIEMEI